jgi:hypothetical protein
MSETQRPRHIGRSIGAVLAGFVVVVLLSLGTDVVLHATRVFPPWGQPMDDALFLLATWNAGPAFGPHWYPVATVATALPCAWVGGTLRERQLRDTR